MRFHPDEWARVKEVFEGARAVAFADRRALPTGACGGDEELRNVERLLAAHQLASSLLEAPVAFSGDSLVTISPESGQIAGYELVAFIGAGGMGQKNRRGQFGVGRGSVSPVA